MRLLCTIACFCLLLPLSAFPARLVVTVPQGISEVELLSGGTQAVLDHLRKGLNVQLKAVSDRCQIGRIEAELKASALKVAGSDKAYSDKIDSLRKQFISKAPITIHKADAQITTASALGEITFAYTVRNSSDKIISDITYKPMIGKTPLPITTMLVLEFINPKSLVFGLGPGESLSNEGGDPERLSFFLSELSANDINRIKNSMPGGFSVEVTDIHFVSQKGYKGQTKVMDIKEAFSDVLREYQGASQLARQENQATENALAQAKAVFEKDTKGLISDFRNRSYELKKASKRYEGSVDPRKNRVTIESITPGAYFLYAPSMAGKKAFFKQITIEEGRNKLKIENTEKDPFEP